MHPQTRREAVAVMFFVLASVALWAGVYGLTRIQHPGKAYYAAWLGLTYAGYMMAIIAWNRRGPRRRREEPDPEPEVDQMNPPAKLPPPRFS